MADGVRDLRNLPLADLIGAPLAAMIDAEAQAARTTVDFIRQVGFVGPEGNEAEEAGTEFPRELGPLRTVQFRYQKLDEDGVPATFQASVPLLALVPVPGVRIRSGKVTFTARITDVVERQAVIPEGRVRASGVQLRGGLSPGAGPLRRAATEEQTRGAFEIDIDVELESAPLTVGIEKLLTTFDQAIAEEKVQGLTRRAGGEAMRVVSGSTEPGATNWQPYSDDTGVYVDIDTSEHGFATTPRYFTSLGGASHHWTTTGVTSIYNANPSGFRVYVRWATGATIKPEEANERGWHINWLAVEEV